MANTYNIKVTGTLDTSKIQEALKSVEQKYGNVKIGTGAASGIKSIGTAAKESKGMLGEFTSQLTNLSSTIPKVAAFGVATMAVNAFRDAIADGVQQVFELDGALTEFKKVSDLSGDSLDEYADKLGQLGETVARTKSEMVEAATEFVKSGYSEADSANLAQVASLYQNIADEEISAGESASFIIAQMKAFNITAEDSIHIVDAVNEVSNNFAVSSADLATNLGKVSSTLAVTGTSFEESLGMLTAITEITRNASMASRGLKQISSRLTQTLDESSSTGAKLKEIYSDLGISLVNEEGQIRSTYDILQDLSKQWDGLSKNQQEYIALTSAGSNQVQNFTALMDNFGVAIKATETAYDSAGSAAKENSAYMESLEAKVQGLKAAWQNLVTDGGTLNKFIKLIIDGGTAILKFANSDIGQTIIKIGALGLAIKGVSALGKNFLVGWIPQMVGMQGATIGLTGAINGLTTALLENPLFWVAAGGLLIFGLAKIIDTDAEKFAKLQKAVEDTNNAIAETESEYNQLSSKPVEDLTQSEKERLEILKQQLDVLRQQKQEQQQQAYAAMPQSTVKTTISGGDGVGGGLGVGAIKVSQTAVQDYIKTLDSLNGVEAEVRKSLADTAEQLLEFKDAGVELNEADQEFLETYNMLTEAYNVGSEAAQNYGNTLGGVVMQQMQQLTAAMQEQNEAGYISEQTYNNLLNIFPDLANYVDTTTGRIILNTSAVHDLIGATSAARNAAYEFINGQGAMQIQTNATTQEIRRQIVALLEQARAAYASYQSLPDSAIRSMPTSELNKYINARANIDKIKGALNRLDAGMLEIVPVANSASSAISNVGNSYSGSTGATKSNTKATQSNTKATKANTDAQEKAKKAHDELVKSLKDVADAYKTAAKYMTSQIEIEINTLEKRKDAIEESYNAQIQAIQDANDAIEEQMELEKAQQALEEAKKKRQLVFTGGQFQYVEDAKAIAEAQENLNNIIRQQEMEQQVQNLENARDAELKAIDDQIAGWEKYKEQWESLADSYEEQQDKLIAQQVLGIKLEGDNWQKRLKNAQAFVDQYKKIMAQLDVLEGSDTSTPKSAQTVLNQAKTFGKKGFANGTTSTPAGIYKVGEAGSELMVGRGNGVIPHNLTENLMRLGQFSPSEWVNSLKGTFADKTQTVVQQFGDISLPNVSNASQFVEQLKQFKNYAVQATSRR